MMISYSEIAAKLLTFESRDLGTGTTEDDIAAAEKVLEMRIEGAYRQFLLQFGWGGAGHIELYGLGAGVPPYLDVVQMTRSEREEMDPRLQRHLLALMNDGGGNLYCLDTRVPNEPPVVFWDHTAGADQIPDVVAGDFSSWLAEQLSNIEE